MATNIKEYERQFIAKLLQDNDVIYQTKVEPRHIGDALCRSMLEAAQKVVSRGDTANIITITAEGPLQRHAADVAEISGLFTTANLQFYEREIISGYRTRELLKLSEELKELATAPDDALATLDLRIEEITQETESDRVHSMRDIMPGVLDELESRYKNKGQMTGIRSGYSKMDAVTAGFQPSMLYYIGARPSQGKSAILMNIATYIVLKERQAVGIISAESSKNEIAFRDLANVGSIDSMRIKTGMFTDADFTSLKQASATLGNAPLFIYDAPNVSITRLVAVAKVMRRRYGIKALFVDYLQIIGSSLRNSPRRDQVAEVSLRMKQLARELDIPVICAAQLTRDSEERRPSLRDFAESSQAEKDADVAILLHPEKDGEGNQIRTWAYIDKNRDGPKGEVRLQFVGKYVRFHEEAQEEI